MVRDKVRIRFRKAGDLRWTSHHDLMRCFERMLRRAALPFRSTKGFNPRPRLVFAQPLPLGVVGCGEFADLDLDELLPPDEIRNRLASQAPPGLAILGVERVSLRASLQPQSATYRLPVPGARHEEAAARAAEVLACSECWVERTRPTARRVNICPYLAGVSFTDDSVEVRLTITPNGGARPDEIFRLLGLGDVLDAGAILERTHLELAPTGDAPLATLNWNTHLDSCPQEKDTHEERNAD